MKPLARFELWCDHLTRGTAFIGFIGLIAVAGITVVDVLLRWLFDAPIDGVDDISRLAFAVIIASCFPAVLFQGRNITIRFVGSWLGPTATRWLNAFGDLLTASFFMILAWQFVILAWDAAASGDRTMIIKTVTWPWWTITTAVVVACVVVQFFVVGRTLRWARLAGASVASNDGREDVSRRI